MNIGIIVFGVLLVALMAYLSTRIKKSASEAYELEEFDNGEFKITKPEGFIIPYNEKSPYLMEAYSRDFGDDDARKLNQCWATISVAPGVKKDRTATTSKVENGVNISVFTKSAGNKKTNKTYELEISVLDDCKEAFTDKVNLMLESFAVI